MPFMYACTDIYMCAREKCVYICTRTHIKRFDTFKVRNTDRFPGTKVYTTWHLTQKYQTTKWTYYNFQCYHIKPLYIFEAWCSVVSIEPPWHEDWSIVDAAQNIRRRNPTLCAGRQRRRDAIWQRWRTLASSGTDIC